MNLLVTGFNGWIARVLAEQFRARGHTVRGAARQADGADCFAISALDGKTDWRLALQNVDCVCHLAARLPDRNAPSMDALPAFREVNVAGTLNLARQAAMAGVKRFVFVSSIKVNGESTTGNDPFRAEDAPHPEDAYGLSKREAEDGLTQIAEKTGMEIVIIRPPLVYGPGVKGNFAAMVRWMQKGIPLPLGAVDNSRSLVALDNLVDFIALCADRDKSPHASNQVFLVSDGDDVSTTELLQRVARAYGARPRLIPIPAAWLRRAARLAGKEAVADRLLGSLRVDSAKARTLLGWHPVVTMDEQLKKMAEDAAHT